MSTDEAGKTVRPWTSGEWVVDRKYSIDRMHVAISGDGWLALSQVVVVLKDNDDGYCDPSAEGEANARLITAAPALYEALEAMLSANSKMKIWELGAIKHMAESALRKANPAAFEAPGHE